MLINYHFIDIFRKIVLVTQTTLDKVKELLPYKANVIASSNVVLPLPLRPIRIILFFVSNA